MSSEASDPKPFDPRATLANWANQSDEWVRYIVRQVLSASAPLSTSDVDIAYRLFREEKALDQRELPAEDVLQIEEVAEEAEQDIKIRRLSEVAGVNALVPGGVIEPHEGLTILFGENGTGKTGYARILKALAKSRSVDEVLGDVTADTPVPQSARLDFTLGSEDRSITWRGESGVAPFTRMSIFDNPCVNFHVDADLDYVYTPSVLALFNHVNAGLKAVQEKIEAQITSLSTGSNTFLARFPRQSVLYPIIETLGSSTDLSELKARVSVDVQAPEKIETSRRAVAAIESDAIAPKLTAAERIQRLLTQSHKSLQTLSGINWSDLNSRFDQRRILLADYEAFRKQLFADASLPTDPDATWEAFVSAGETYRNHLKEEGVHDEAYCLYCRQALNSVAQDLVGRYGEYVVNKIKADITRASLEIETIAKVVRTTALPEVSAFLEEYRGRQDRPAIYNDLQTVVELIGEAIDIVNNFEPVPNSLPEKVAATETSMGRAQAVATQEVETLRLQSENKATALAEEKKKLNELIASHELRNSWPEIEMKVKNSKESDRLRTLAKQLPNLVRNVTELTKAASDQLINRNFEQLFHEECDALRAPELTVEFVGRQGKAQRRKALSGRKPSKVLSEGEQKVLAMADFLAEARLAGINAPVIFDDPVSSLDHRRIHEVARRIASLAEVSQVIVFTHDIFFATTLLGLMEQSRRCTYYQISDDNGKGQVAQASGPRWDTLNSIKREINQTIQAAQTSQGEAKAALIRTGYNWIRSWCELFVELELLKGVTQRYQPNVRMTVLTQIKASALPDAVSIVQPIFEEACRYIDGHSQPLATLGVRPGLPELERHWAQLQKCKSDYDAAP